MDLPPLAATIILRNYHDWEECRLERKTEVIVKVSYVTNTQEARAAQEILKIGLRRALAKLDKEIPRKDKKEHAS